MSNTKLPMRIRYEYEQAQEVSPRTAHGVWGGINAQGEIEVNFYTESDKLPLYSERIVSPDGVVGHEMTPYDENVKTVTRRIHAKILLNYHTAKDILEWLEDKVETIEMETEGPFRFEEESGPEQ